MSNKVKDIDIKNQAYYFSHDVINIKHFDANNVKIDERLYKNILIIYYIGYVMTKASKYVKVNSANLLHLIFIKMNGYFEEINGNKYLMLVPTNNSKENTKQYEDLPKVNTRDDSREWFLRSLLY